MRVLFIGVTTARSSIVPIFPLWMQELGRPDVTLEGIDLPLQADPALYREVVQRIKSNHAILGALVTSHKLALLAASRDLFDSLDPDAQLCSEVSAIARRGDTLAGYATDPTASTLTLREFAPATPTQVLCLGAGGAATAITLQFIRNRAPLQRLTLVDRAPDRLAALRRMVANLDAPFPIDYLCHQDPAANDRLLAALPPRSLVINATGMGKDLPGSPLTDAALFPLDSVVWELNYRGELAFLRQAERQQLARRLTLEDGWRYFLHGWTQVIEKVLNVRIDAPLFHRLAQIADGLRRFQ